jgi:hypothetical protein
MNWLDWLNISINVVESLVGSLGVFPSGTLDKVESEVNSALDALRRARTETLSLAQLEAIRTTKLW